MKWEFNKARRILPPLLCGAAVLFLCGFAAWPSQLALTAADGTTGRIVYAVRMQPGDTFAIHYLHSVHKTPVEERYRISAEEEMVLERVVYASYGIGNPSGVEEGARFRMEGGKLILEGIDRRMKTFRLRIARIVGSQEIVIGGKSMPLSAWSPPGSVLVLEVKRLSLFALWTTSPQEGRRNMRESG